jgi:hypothetical protein
VLQDVLKAAHLDAAAGLCEGAAWQAKLLVAQLQLLATQERAADAEVAPALRDLPKTEGSLNDAEIIMSAPGFAEHTTSVLLAEAGAVISRCDDLELRAVCGAAPVTKSTGKRREKSKWTKNQNVDGVVVMRCAVNMRLPKRSTMPGTRRAATRASRRSTLAFESPVPTTRVRCVAPLIACLACSSRCCAVERSTSHLRRRPPDLGCASAHVRGCSGTARVQACVRAGTQADQHWT